MVIQNRDVVGRKPDTKMRPRPISPSDWKIEIEKGLDYRRKFGLEDTWAESEALFYNVHPQFSMEFSSPNLIFAIGDALISNLTVPDPYLQIEPLRADSVAAAPVLESVDNMLIDDLGFKEEVEHVSLHAYLFGAGFMKFGYDSEWGYDPKQGFKQEGEEEDLGFTLTQFNRKGESIEYNNNVRPGMPWVHAVDPRDIVLPWGTRTVHNCPWVVHRVIRHIDDIKADPKYSKKRDLRGNMSMEDFVDSYKRSPGSRNRLTHTTSMSSFASRKSDFVELWEIHDLRTGRIKVVATGHESFLRDDENLLQLDGPPFLSLTWTPRSRSLWTTPDAFYLRAGQNELNDIQKQRSKQRRLAVIKFAVREGAIDEEELNKAMSSEVGAVFKYKDGFDLREAFQPVHSSPAHELQPESEQVRRDSREIVGFSRNQLGEFETSGRRTAREAGIVQQGAETRMNRRQLAIRDQIYIPGIRKINLSIFKFWKLPQVTKIVGKDNVETWVQYTGEQLSGNYRYSVKFIDESALGQVRAQALQQYAFMREDPNVDQAGLLQLLISQVNDPKFTQAFNLRGGGGATQQPTPSPGAAQGALPAPQPGA